MRVAQLWCAVRPARLLCWSLPLNSWRMSMRHPLKQLAWYSIEIYENKLSKSKNAYESKGYMGTFQGPDAPLCLWS